MTSLRMPRAWARLAAAAALASALGSGAAAVLLEEDPPAPAEDGTEARITKAEVATVATAARGHGQTTSAEEVSYVDLSTPTAAARTNVAWSPAAPPPAAPPASVRQVATTASTPAELGAWVSDRSLAPQLRYTALRRLEGLAPADAVTAAIGCLDDTASLVRLNAIALLARIDDPRAKTALARVDPRSQRLAQALRRS